MPTPHPSPSPSPAAAAAGQPASKKRKLGSPASAHCNADMNADMNARPAVPADKPVDFERTWSWFRSLGSPKFVIAPMVKQSELAYRMLCRQHNATLCYTQMFHAKQFLTSEKVREVMFKTHPDEGPLFAQFCGDDPLTLLASARLIQDQVDAIDLNLGCPQGIARRGHYGSFLLSEPDLLVDIVRTLHNGLDIPVTCKIRILPSEEETYTLCQRLQDAGTVRTDGQTAGPTVYSITHA